MAKDLLYSEVPGKISDLFKKISDAKVPDSFVTAFLKDTLGFKSNKDRSLIGLLKALGMLESSGAPTARYRQLKNNSTKGKAIADGIRDAYSPLYHANENVHTLTVDDMKGLIAQVAGSDKDRTARICSTLNALIKEADFTVDKSDQVSEPDEFDEEDKTSTEQKIAKVMKKSSTFQKLNSEFHFNIQIHLPNNGTEETYLNIFNALREAFD